MESLVVRVLQRNVFEAFKSLDETITDHLHLGLMRYCLKVWVKDATLCIQRLAVSIARACGVEPLCKLKLCFRCGVRLVLQNKN